MKNYIYRIVFTLLTALFPFYCQAKEIKSTNPAHLGKQEEIARKNMLDNPSQENRAKHKEIVKDILDAAEKFALEYHKDQKKE